MSKIKLPEQTRKALKDAKPYRNYMVEKLKLDGYTPKTDFASLVLQFVEIYNDEFTAALKNNPDAFDLDAAWTKIKKGANSVLGILNSLTQNNNPPAAAPPEKDNTMLYLIGGGIALLGVVLLVKK